ncbi:lmo0937 family membrane protein [Foetidibacter luteolus]|uniref:lmo0937 family membrane protein n=1 Tax=Foetidibacter luteolus TaxID=2608880 RepID=UPI00351FC4B1
MKSFLFTLSIILITVWLTAVNYYHASGLIHLMPVVAVIALIIALRQNAKV